MAIIISDTNVFIDLCEVGLLESFFSLDEEIHTVKQVVFELIDKAQSEYVAKFVEEKKLHVKSFSLAELMELNNFSEQCSNRLSEPDVAVIFYGKQTGGIILSGDRRLRSKAESIGLEVHGVLYIIYRLYTDGIITAKKAIESLENLKASNNRLPKSDIERLIAQINP
ncbi:MAG: hypothetical protein K6F33_02020 [Bacteroidales bacterium]|nr:hypothetical protein [Bacteroidales bacterium]